MNSLPVDRILSGIFDALREKLDVVLVAPPGAGKTTRVPRALLSSTSQEVVVLEPRRLAARMAARRVAEEMGERLGETVGYQVRFERVASAATRLRFLTEGVFTRRMISDPLLAHTGIVVLDEFHERHLETDLALASVRRLQRTSRPDLRLVVMSATIDAAAIAGFLGRAAVLHSEGRLYPTAVEHSPASAAPLEEQVAAAFDRVLAGGVDGHVLVFLPGAAEIRRAANACAGPARRAGFDLAPLHGDLPPAEQDRAVLPSDKRKLILSTNVAESSITIEGVTVVIDSGLARVATDDPWTGLPSLNVARICKASCRQRAGRAGRTAPGRVIRLFSEDDFVRRPEHDPPEIERRELSHLLLDLHALGSTEGLEWLTPPPEAAVSAAQALLSKLAALDERGSLTAAGKRMVQIPLHPRLSRLVLEAERLGAGALGCAAAAVLSTGERLSGSPPHGVPSDLLVLAEQQWQFGTERARRQIQKAAGIRGKRSDSENDAALLKAVLLAFPDRVGRRRTGREYQLGSGLALLSEASAVESEFLVAVDVEKRRDRALPSIRIASAIEPEWLLELFPGRIEERDQVEWNREAERVDRVSSILYDGLAIDESRSGDPDPDAAAALLAERALDGDLGRFLDRDSLAELLDRTRFAGEHGAGPALGEQDLAAAIRKVAGAGLRSFADLQRAGLLAAMRERAHPQLDRVAPARIALPGGRSVKVHYPEGQPPWIESRLQDFFGMSETPRVAGVPVVIRLLAPNGRPVQTTSDLAGFWQRLYPQVRRELSRRYPKHKWPELPAAK